MVYKHQISLFGWPYETWNTVLYSFYYMYYVRQPRWLSGLKRSRVQMLMIARRSLCPEKLGSNPCLGSKGINFSGWHGLDMSVAVTKRR